MADLRVASCLRLPEPDPDAEPLAEAFARVGVEAAVLGWDDPAADWDAPLPTLIRATWTYARFPDEFFRWLERVAAAGPLWNPYEVVRANVHKRYLLELPARGVAAVPTELVARGGTATLDEMLAQLGDGRSGKPLDKLVVKPAIGAGSLDTEVFRRGDDARFTEHLTRLVARGDALVQPFIDSVHEYGERSMVWIDGELSHAIRKTPRFAGDDERVEGPVPIAEDEAKIAEAALAPLAAQLLYARVDLARDAQGQPMVMEMELIEPSLFFTRRPGSADRLVAALMRRLAGK